MWNVDSVDCIYSILRLRLRLRRLHSTACMYPFPLPFNAARETTDHSQAVPDIRERCTSDVAIIQDGSCTYIYIYPMLPKPCDRVCSQAEGREGSMARPGQSIAVLSTDSGIQIQIQIQIDTVYPPCPDCRDLYPPWRSTQSAPTLTQLLLCVFHVSPIHAHRSVRVWSNHQGRRTATENAILPSPSTR